jgi:hypothetical protein
MYSTTPFSDFGLSEGTSERSSSSLTTTLSQKCFAKARHKKRHFLCWVVSKNIENEFIESEFIVNNLIELPVLSNVLKD